MRQIKLLTLICDRTMNIATYCRHYISISYYLYNVFTGYVNIMFISRIHNVSQVDVTSVKVSLYVHSPLAASSSSSWQKNLSFTFGNCHTQQQCGGLTQNNNYCAQFNSGHTTCIFLTCTIIILKRMAYVQLTRV